MVRYRIHKVVRLQSNASLCDNCEVKHIPLEYNFKHFKFFNRELDSLAQESHERLSKTLFLTNWFNGYVHSNNKRWFEIVDFDSNAGDIKGVWELSRWYWAIEIASDKEMSLYDRRDMLESFSKLWLHQNPYLNGPNWKCGQEVALRLIHFLVAMRLLDYNPKDLTSSQNQFLKIHLRRIYPSISYAKGQKNNHWISEAVGLIIGGLWLKGKWSDENYYQRGIEELSEALDVLFNDDGSFAQSSFNYLRHALTLIAVARLEVSHNGRDCKIFESQKLKNALYLYDQFCETSSPTTHNWGANDGSNPLAISKSKFLDPLAHKCFYDFAFKGIPSTIDNNVVAFLIEKYSPNIVLPEKFFLCNSDKVESPNLKSGFTEFPDGGLIFYQNKDYRVLVRLPKFNFKPSQDDVGHIDIIRNGKGVLLDAGTYSYFTNDDTFSYFQGVQSHNTLYRVYEKYSMKKLSRFIFGGWTKGSWFIVGDNKLVIKFKNKFSDHFVRTLDFQNGFIAVHDRVISSTTSHFFSGITLNSISLKTSSESFGVRIKTEPEADSSDTVSIHSLIEPVISDVPVSFCYGYKIPRKRLQFPLKNQEVKFEIHLYN